MNRYVMRWKDDGGHDLTVIIYDILSTGDTVTELVPGASPFVIRSQADEDVMRPVRYTSAVVTVICNYADILPMDDSKRYRIVFKRGSEVLWLGWLTSDVMYQGFSSVREEFSYNAVDDLGFMQSCNFSYDMGSFPTIKNIVTYASSLFRDKGEACAQSLYIGNGMPVLTDIATTFAVSVNIGNYISSELDDSGNEVLSAYPLSAFFADLMSLFGCTISSNGVDWFISSPDDTLRTQAIPLGAGFAAAIDAASFTEPFTSVTAESLDEAGNHTITIENPMKSVSVNAGDSDTSGNILPDMSTDFLVGNWYRDIVFRYTGDNNQYVQTPQAINWKAYNFISNILSGIFLHRYLLVKDGDLAKATIGDEIAETDARLEVNTNQANILWAYGGCMLKEDYYNTSSTIDEGSGSGAGKRNYEFHDRLYLIQAQFNHGMMDDAGRYQHLMEPFDVTGKDRPFDVYRDIMTIASAKMNRPMLTVRSTSVFVCRGGGLCITFDCWAGLPFQDDYSLPLGPLKIKSAIVEGSLYTKYMVIASLKVGDRWWTDGTWKTSEGKLYILADDDGVIDTKILTENYTCEGYSINIGTSILSGKAELSIYGICAVSTEYVQRGWQGKAMLPAMGMIEDVKIDYCPPLDDLLVAHDKELKKTQQGITGEDEYDIQTSLCSANERDQKFGTLYHGGKKLPKMSAEGYTGTAYPEILTLDRAGRLFFKSRRMITLTLAMDDMPDGGKRLSYDGKEWMMLYVVSCNYTTGTITSVYLQL